MERTEIVLNTNQQGEIQLFSDDRKAGKMDVSVAEGKVNSISHRSKS
jgi:hypothetical protein